MRVGEDDLLGRAVLLEGLFGVRVYVHLNRFLPVIDEVLRIVDVEGTDPARHEDIEDDVEGAAKSICLLFKRAKDVAQKEHAATVRRLQQGEQFRVEGCVIDRIDMVNDGEVDTDTVAKPVGTET